MFEQNNLSDKQDENTGINGIHNASCEIARKTLYVGMASFFPPINLVFGTFAYLLQQGIWDSNITFTEAYENGMEVTGIVFVASALIALATHPALASYTQPSVREEEAPQNRIAPRSSSRFFSGSASSETEETSNQNTMSSIV